MDPAPSQSPERHPGERVLIYDGACRLCVTAKRGLERLGEPHTRSEVRFVPYQSEEAACRLGATYRAGRPEAAFLVDANGNVERGLDAFLPLLPGIPGGRLLLRLLRVRWLRPVAYALYRFIARYRYRLFGQVPYRHGDDL
jgi:predicted DCC family thiol-disulfide oxidoreductase YuxK